MREHLDHWKEGAGVLLYFGFLAYFTPKAKALGWGMEGMMLCVIGGAVVIGLLYLLLKGIASYIEDHREEVSSFKEYMGIGSAQHTDQVNLAAIGTIDEHTNAELDALLATNPYASAELFEDEKYTRLLPAVQADEEEDAQGVDEEETEQMTPDGRVSEIMGKNPRRRLLLADNFQPDANKPLTTGMFFSGMPDSGKTTVMALVLEEYIKRYRLPAVAFDLEGDLKSIVEDGLCPRGLIVTPDALPDWQKVIQYRMQVIVDLQQCKRPGEEFINYELAAQLITKITKALMNAQAVVKASGQEPISCLLALDETHIWTPQNPPSYLESKTYKELLDTMTVVATRGRKYGVVPFLACQRIAKVHNDIISGCGIRILGKVDLDNDISRYRKYVSKAVISDQGLRALGRGRMIVCMDGKRLFVHFYNRKSRHTSHTPGVTGALDQFALAGNIPADLLASITRPVEVARPASLPVYTPPPVERVEQERKTSGSLPTVAPVPQPLTVASEPESMREIDLQEAARFWRAGHDSTRRLARALGVSDYQGAKIYTDLVEAGLIEKKPARVRVTTTSRPV